MKKFFTNQWLQTNRYHFIAFCILLGVIIILAVNNVLYYSPTISFYLNTKSKPSPQEQELLNNTSKTLSSEEYNRVFSEAQTFAKKTSYLEIGNCIPRPRNIKVKRNGNLLIRNSSKQVHFLSLGRNKTASINPGQTQSVLLDFFSYAPAVYGFGCDRSPQAIGTFLVEE